MLTYTESAAYWRRVAEQANRRAQRLGVENKKLRKALDRAGLLSGRVGVLQCDLARMKAKCDRLERAHANAIEMVFIAGKPC